MRKTRNHEVLEVRPVALPLGAEIRGINLALGVDATQFSRIYKAYNDFGVIFFHGQDLNSTQFLQFARMWGEININRFFKTVDTFPMIAELVKEPHQDAIVGSRWHSDHSYDLKPAMGSILYALETPNQGGDTLFVSTQKAYDTLPSEMKKRLEGLYALHSSRHVFGGNGYAGANEDLSGRLRNQIHATQDAVHPMVIRHPKTGRKALYINPNFTVKIIGLTEEDSLDLLQELYTHVLREKFIYRFSWAVGSIAFWDNRATWHRALNDYPGERRVMHRITIEGERLLSS